MKDLSSIVELMGGKLSYSLEHGWYEYKVTFGRMSVSFRDMKEQKCIDFIRKYLEETYPMQWINAKNQLK